MRAGEVGESPVGPDRPWGEGRTQKATPTFERPGLHTWKPPTLVCQSPAPRPLHRTSLLRAQAQLFSLELGPSDPNTHTHRIPTFSSLRPSFPPVGPFPNSQKCSFKLLFLYLFPLPWWPFPVFSINKYRPSLQSPTQKSPPWRSRPRKICKQWALPVCFPSLGLTGPYFSGTHSSGHVLGAGV